MPVFVRTKSLEKLEKFGYAGTRLGFCVRFCLTDPQKKNHSVAGLLRFLCVELSEENLFRKFLLRRTNKQKGANKTSKAKLNARPLHVF